MGWMSAPRFRPLPALVGWVGLGLCTLALPALAQDVRLAGQLRPRYEARSPAIPAAPVADVQMRARLGFVARLPEGVSVHISLQDVVSWGASDDGPAGASDPDLFIGFVEVADLRGSGTTLRAGRQEIVLGNQRLVSNNNWGHRGSRLDGVRLLRDDESRPSGVFAVRLLDGGVAGSRNAWLHGAHAAVPVRGREMAHLYALYHRETGPEDTHQFTFGGHTEVTLGGIGWIAEGYLQRGERQDVAVTAHQFAFGATRRLDAVRVRVQYEHASGGGGGVGDPVRSFDRPRGSNHRFHGAADLFTTALATTGGLGLGDLNFRLEFVPAASTELEVRAHAFRTGVRGDLTSRQLGEELDLVVTHRPRSGLALEGGISRVFAGPALGQLRGLERDLTFGYVMLTVAF